MVFVAKEGGKDADGFADLGGGEADTFGVFFVDEGLFQVADKGGEFFVGFGDGV